MASPPPLERFPAVSRYGASPNPAIPRGRALQPPDPPRVVVAAETAAAEAGRRAEPRPRPDGSAAALAFRHAFGPNPFGPHAESEGELFCGGPKPEAAFLAGGRWGRGLAEAERRADVALCLGTGIRPQSARRRGPASGREKE